ncbi:histidine phosphatase family protein [Streptomyces sp. NPDC097981]|uniref:SixA phosphatase family protein n=1 Tax=Streptomyces sp. NPDC097981 TaxID=3155428 RepID=UPI00332DDABC
MSARERRIVVVRHAKAVPKDVAADFDRALADRGRSDSPEGGRWLARQGLPLGLARCSSARRTRQTWGLMLPQLPDPPPTVYEDRLYRTDADGLLTVLAQTPVAVAGLLIVGHNPAVHELAHRLCGDGPKQLVNRVGAEFPTAAVAVLTVTGDWADVTWGGARLTAFWAPGD